LTSIIRSARKVAKDFMAINSSETSAESMVMNDLIGELENAELLEFESDHQFGQNGLFPPESFRGFPVLKTFSKKTASCLPGKPMGLSQKQTLEALNIHTRRQKQRRMDVHGCLGTCLSHCLENKRSLDEVARVLLANYR